MTDVGDEAPGFELRDQTGQPVRLSDYRGKKHVVLVFYPASFTRVCGTEMCEIRDELPQLRTDEVETLAVSCDPVPVQRTWSEQEGFEFPLLADFWPHGEVARRFGVFDERVGKAERVTFIVDAAGIVRARIGSETGGPRDQSRYLDVLDELGPPQGG